MIYDITPSIDEHLKVWPGDTPPSREVMCELKKGDSTTLSTLHTTVHVGAHADAPSHYAIDGQSIDQRSLECYVGPCQVIAVKLPAAARLTSNMLETPIRAERVLFATGSSPNPSVFNEDFAALSPSLIDHLANEGVKLVGIDTPSVDLFDSKDLPSHARAMKHDLAILEGLVLDSVPDGVYELIALPLKLVGFDGSPVRAILRTMP